MFLTKRLISRVCRRYIMIVLLFSKYVIDKKGTTQKELLIFVIYTKTRQVGTFPRMIFLRSKEYGKGIRLRAISSDDEVMKFYLSLFDRDAFSRRFIVSVFLG